MGQMTNAIKKGNNLTGKLVKAMTNSLKGKKRKKVGSDSSSSGDESGNSSGD